MANSYIVIRLVPETPVDGASFLEYLEGLNITVNPASGGASLGEASYLPLVLATDPLDASQIDSTFSLPLLAPTAQSNPGNKLYFQSVDGVALGAFVVVLNGGSNAFQDGTYVTDVSATDNSVTFNNPVPTGLQSQAIVTFATVYQAGQLASGVLTVTTKSAAGSSGAVLQFPVVPPPPASAKKPPQPATYGIFPDMNVAIPSGNYFAAGAIVTVVEVHATSVTLSAPLITPLSAGVPVVFTALAGQTQGTTIAPDIEVFTYSIGSLFSNFTFTYFIPQAAATAVIAINPMPAPGGMLNVEFAVTRGNKPIALPQKIYYNLQPVPSAYQIPPPFAYSSIPPLFTNLYISLPAPPLTTLGVALTIPTDGSAPPFDLLYPAMVQALQQDPAFMAAPSNISQLSATQCSQVAYDIVWSMQNALPLPPDPVDDLYTNPPNTGSSSTNGSNNNSVETDRLKFEGTLNSYYSTRNATAERLAKFVAAASAAIYCEQTSLNAASALLEFPVDPSEPFNIAVESEIQ